ncbi:hypothetical protein KAR48_00130 [bacterium]|nr:hypothetical protein [bacterium]
MKLLGPLSSVEEKILILVLRAVGVMSFLALFFVFVPFEWMTKLHELAGLGLMPAEPIVEYLARSTSIFYAFLGVIKLLAATDVHKYRSLVLAISGFMLIFGMLFIVIDYLAGLGVVWALAEGGMNIFFGIIIFWFALRLPKE